MFLFKKIPYLCRKLTTTIMEEVIKLDTPEQYNQMFGLESQHPLVSVVDLSQASGYPMHFTLNYGIYALFLKNARCGDIRYGKQFYDYQEGTVTSFAPGQVTEVSMMPDTRLDALGLLFHPDLIKGTSLGQGIKQYTFFSYTSNEALHLSEEEKGIFTDCLRKIRTEALRPVDKHSKRLIARNIELLLDYCMRFYDRQFVTRAAANRDILTRFEALLDEYFQSDRPHTDGLPSVRYFADRVFLSPNYFGDLIKKETGKSAQEYIQQCIIDLAKEMIAGSRKPVSQIAYELGYQYSQHFNRVFKKNVGCTPSKYRLLQA